MNYNENLINNLKKLNVKCGNLKKEETDESIWNGIFESNLYPINASMLEQFFNRRDFWKRSYTYIFYRNSHIKDYVNNNIDDYMDLVLNRIPANSQTFFCDAEQVEIDLLNNERLTRRFKDAYISKMKNNVGNLSKIASKDLWDVLLKNYKTPVTVENILTYFCNIERDDDAEKEEILIEFINKLDGVSSLDFRNADWTQYGNKKREFYEMIISSEKLDADAIKILKQCYEEKYDLTKLPPSVKGNVVEIMIENGILANTAHNYQKIINSYEDKLCELVAKNPQLFCSMLKQKAIKIDKEKIAALLYCDEKYTSETEKLEIARAYEGEIPPNVQMPQRVLLELLKFHADNNKLWAYFGLYNNEEFREEAYAEFRKKLCITDYKAILRNDYPELYERLKKDGVFDKFNS